MIKLSTKQAEEIDFFSKYADTPFTPTIEEIQEYIDVTVHGKKERNYGNGLDNMPRLIASKRGFDITIKEWRQALVDGLIGIEELFDDFKDYPYGKRLVASVLKGLDFSKRNIDGGFVDIALKNSYIKNLVEKGVDLKDVFDKQLILGSQKQSCEICGKLTNSYTENEDKKRYFCLFHYESIGKYPCYYLKEKCRCHPTLTLKKVV
jgi:hypothetical protein